MVGVDMWALWSHWAGSNMSSVHLALSRSLGTMEAVRITGDYRSFIVHSLRLTFCRVGYGGQYDLRLLDNGTSGSHHSGHSCHQCHVTPVFGIRWGVITVIMTMTIRLS